MFLAGHGRRGDCAVCAADGGAQQETSAADRACGPGAHGSGPRASCTREYCICGHCAGAAHGPVNPAALARLSAALLSRAADVLSGPAGLAAFLRGNFVPAGRPFVNVSLPLDTGKATEEIPAHLRRAVILRDRCCGFPGCGQPPAACQVHHIRPRRKGGATSLRNLILLCRFHHLIAVHRWGWEIALHPDGTVAATSPDGQRVLHSHGPPPARAA